MQYEDDCREMGHNAHGVMAGKVAGFFPEVEEWAEVKILDVAAGTGRVGEELAKLGFRNIDAVGEYEVIAFR